MLRRYRTTWILPLALLLLLTSLVGPGDVRAQAPATIKGTVRDGETGELLDYANILLAGTTRGTMTLGGGVFYFQGMAPGTYTVKVLYLGLCRAYFTSGSGETAGVGSPTSEGWSWAQRPEIADEVLRIMAVHQKSSQPQIISLPVQLQTGEARQ